jgi:hypothetical protein
MNNYAFCPQECIYKQQSLLLVFQRQYLSVTFMLTYWVWLSLVSGVLLHLQVMLGWVALWHQNHFHGKAHPHLTRTRTVPCLLLSFMGHTLKSKQVSQHLVLLAIQVRWHCTSNFINSFTNRGSWGSSVSIVSNYRLDYWAIGVQSLAEVVDFSSDLLSPDRLWGQLSLLSSGYQGPFPWGKARLGHEADHSPPSLVEVKNE